MQTPLDRRSFIKQAGTAGIGLGLASSIGSLARAQPAPGGPADQVALPVQPVRAAVMGTNGRGWPISIV